MGVIIRGIWFVLFGWWLGILWFTAGIGLMASVIFFPVGAYLTAKTWAVMTLKTSPAKVVVEAQSRAE